jgi:hypothetical protein
MAFLVLAVVAAPWVYKIFHALVIEPTAYYWWGVKQVVRIIPEAYYWLFVLACLGVFSMAYLVRDILSSRESMDDPGAQTGPVAFLAETVERSAKSNYFKWVIANRLANIALRIWQVEKGPTKDRQVFDQAPVRSLAPRVRTYLEAGLLSSFMDYRQRWKWIKKSRETPFDLDISIVIEDLESRMES